MIKISHIVLPDSGADLLRRELAYAFSSAGFRVSGVRPEAFQGDGASASLHRLADSGPFLLFSVNFQGLGNLRQILDTLVRIGGSVAVWFVDNPWNILAGVRDPRWKSLPLFVTDKSFIEPLQAHGAASVRHLPLAACFELFGKERQKELPLPGELAPFVFVGRSAFPGKEQFFSSQTMPGDLFHRAQVMLPAGGRPDLRWWEKELDRSTNLWPGKRARLPALGAENANLVWRSLCLDAAARVGLRLCGDRRKRAGLDLFGDAAWQRELPAGVRLSPPVDYYVRLPGIYAATRYTLSLTSMQLPEGLNQRHFDVWAAGGVCFSDATPGLDIFPEELTRPVRFHRPSDMEDIVQRLEEPHVRSDLVSDWQRLLRERHSYAHRVESILEALEHEHGVRAVSR